MVSADCFDAVLPVVADSWEQLRRCDVFRLLNQIHYESAASLRDAGNILEAKRPDYADEIRGCVADLKDELGL